jgi:hypothetical protein
MPDSPFSLASTAKSVHATLDEALLAIPDGKRSAVLIDATNERVQMLLAIRAGAHWQIAGGAVYDGDHVTGHVTVAGSWR